MSAALSFCPRCAQPLALRPHAGRERLACPREGCGFVHWDNPLPVVAAIVQMGDDVILVRAKGWPEKMFGLVTGFLERGEEPAQAVLRELEEELGLSGEVASLVGVRAFAPRHEVLIGYHVQAAGEVRLGEELEAFKRVPIARLRPWDFGTGLLVRDWLTTRAG